MPVRVLIAGGSRTLRELRAANGQLNVVGHVGALEEAEEAMRALRPSVLVLDGDLAQQGGLCSLPALRSASPETAIVLPPVREAGPRVVRAVRMAAADGPPFPRNEGLTVRERDVLQLVALGYTSREIADRLVLSVRTIETHRTRVQRRLGLGSRAELVRWALDHGLLAP